MNSHLDSDANERRRTFMADLRKSADEIQAAGRSNITGGTPDELPIDHWEACGFGVIQRPDDPHGILRISIGGGDLPVNVNYCVFRGDRQACIALLKRALAALEVGPPRADS